MATGAMAIASYCSDRMDGATAIRRKASSTMIKGLDGVTSVQITFHEDKAPERHAMPPGGFRLAIVNCLDIAAGNTGRNRLREFFLSGVKDDARAGAKP